jgi:hypothetical protein
MKITTDSAIKNQINQIAAQLKWLKIQEANASKNNLPLFVKSFQNSRKQLVQLFNSLIGHSNSVVGLAWSTKQNMGCNR